MRRMKKEEIIKRGCQYCINMCKLPDPLGDDNRRKRIVCQYDVCPYSQLDEFNSYTEYLKSKASIIDFDYNIFNKKRG